MFDDKSIELYERNAKRNKTIVTIVRIILSLATFLFWISFAIFRFSDTYVIFGMILFLLFIFQFRIKDDLKREQHHDEYEQRQNDELYKPIKEAFQRESRKQASATIKINDNYSEVSSNKMQDIIIHGEYPTSIQMIIFKIFISYTIALRLIFRGSKQFNDFDLFVTSLLLSFATIYSLHVICQNILKHKFKIDIVNGEVRLVNNERFDLESIQNVVIKEPISTYFYKLSYSIIFYKTGHKIKRVVLHHDLSNYNDIIDTMIKSIRMK